MPSLWHYARRAPMKVRKKFFPAHAEKLHIGSGPQILPGWVNIDNVRYPGVDRVFDVTKGLPFRDVKLIFAEHFIEHLDFHDAMYLMRECRRVLRDDGILRLSTPNLDWVWVSHYRTEMPDDDAVLWGFRLNRAFRGWGHHFLYNFQTLSALLQDAGFRTVKRVQYGESEHEELRGLERHEQAPDHAGLSHILIVEASGRGGTAPMHLEGPRKEFVRDLGSR